MTFCAQASVQRDFGAARDQAMKMIQSAFTLLDQELQKVDRYTAPHRTTFIDFSREGASVRATLGTSTFGNLLDFQGQGHGCVN